MSETATQADNPLEFLYCKAEHQIGATTVRLHADPIDKHNEFAYAEVVAPDREGQLLEQLRSRRYGGIAVSMLRRAESISGEGDAEQDDRFYIIYDDHDEGKFHLFDVPLGSANHAYDHPNSYLAVDEAA